MKFRHLTALFLTLNFLAACSASPAKEPAPTPTVTAPTTDRTLAEQNDLALKLIKQANWEEAILVATKATEIDAASAPAWFNLGRAYLGAGKAAQAVSALRQASALTKAGSADTEYYLGKALEAAGQPGEARSVYQVAKAKWPDDKEIAAALSSLPASPLIPLQEAARAYTAKPGPDTLKTLGTSLDAYLRSPDSKNMGPHGNEMGVMAVLGSPPDPRLVRLHEPGFAWIQWWQGDAPLVYRLYTDPPSRVAYGVSFRHGETWYMVTEQNPLDPKVTRVAVLYRLDAAKGQWLLVEGAFQSFPEKVGSLAVQVRPNSITFDVAGMLSFEERGRTIKVCEPRFQGACATAWWDGKQYVVK